MSLIQVKSIYKNFIDKVILNDVSFAIEQADKIGFVGLNGTGKTTFIKILMGEEETDSNPKTHEEGSILKSPNLTIGYVSQHNVLDDEASVFEELFEVYNLKEIYKNLTLAFGNQDMTAISKLTADFEYGDGYKNQSNIEKTLEGIGIKEDIWHSKISSLSGGEQKKVALAKILLKEPDLLILDEPTNHLDLEAIEWLEGFLIKYKKAFILISHDAYLLNNTTNKTMELERGKLKLYNGNYNSFLAQKELYLASSKKEYDKEQEKIENLKEFVNKYKAGVKSKQAMGRQKLLERITLLEDPIVVQKKMKLKFHATKSNTKEVLIAEELSKEFNNFKLFDKISFKVFQKDRIAILGKNGCGKSTLLKILTGELTDYSGNINFGINTKVGYYDQHNHNLNPKNSILEEIYTNYPITEEEARGIAGSFLFSQDDVLKKISSLSGGEKARVSLIKLSLEKPNLLILDEPTNHLDIYSRKVLEKALKEYEGVILFVSHDRSFIEKITNKIISFNKNTTKVFKGSYSEYKKTLK